MTDQWWRDRGARRVEVMSDWTFGSRSDLEAVMRLELPPEIVEPWLTALPERPYLTYGYVLFATTKP